MGKDTAKKIAFVLLCLLFLCVSCAKSAELAENKDKEMETSYARMENYLQELTARKMEGRRAGTAGEAKAALYLARHFQRLGLQPAGDEGTYFQTFPINNPEPLRVNDRMTLRLSAEKSARPSENVLGVLPGEKEQVIVISAHYDHLGIIEGGFYPGANDNASGVAIVLELAENMTKIPSPYTILFAFWGGEEVGLLGSAYFCRNYTISLDNIACIINLDSLGNLGKNKRLLGWAACEDEFSRNMADKLLAAGWEIKWENNTSHNSDHWSFAKAGIPGFTLLSPDWLEHNHTPQDTINRINLDALVQLMSDLQKNLS